MTDPGRSRSSPTPAGAGIARVDEHNPVWNHPGYHVDNSQSWGPISASVVTRPAGEGVWRSDYHRITYCPVGHTVDVQYENGPMRRYQLLANQLAFVPRGVEARINLPLPVQFIQIRQNPETYDGLISDMVRGGAAHLYEPSRGINDPLASQIALTIGNEMKRGFLDRILADALNTALAVQITRHFVDLSKIALTPSNGLSRERLNRVQDYIEAHLDDRLTLTELAGVACLSSYHFSRSFKQATGAGLHHYVMQRRLERAKALMRRTNQPLALIALEAGFADQSHLATLFRRETGVTPGQFRAALA
jgi:AraC family transcriptional regulator